jgi:hypothetical protein
VRKLDRLLDKFKRKYDNIDWEVDDYAYYGDSY